MKKFLLLSLFLLCCACTKPRLSTGPSPEQVVRNFLELSSQARDLVDKKKLQDQCLGEMRRAFERMTDEAFRVHYLKNDIKIKTIKFLEVNTQGPQGKVRYRVVIENPQGTVPTEETNEREVELLLSQGAWYLESIRARGSDRIAFTRGMIF